jgi:hypothetical protein
MAIKSANTGIIAVMDSDDISDTNRFFQQISYFEKYDIDLVGGYISEFNPKSEHCTTVRKVPLIHQDIIKRGRWFSPINHVTVMFRKEAYFKTGGYGSLRMVEDYDLFHRMVLANLKFANIPKVLVYVSASDDQYMRRHGLAYFLEEWGLMKRMLSSNYIGLLIFMINVNIRFLYRLIPVYFLKLITQNIFRSRMR